MSGVRGSWKLLHATDSHWIKAGPGRIGFGRPVSPRLRDAAPELFLEAVGVREIFRRGHHALIAIAEALAIAGGVGRGELAFLGSRKKALQPSIKCAKRGARRFVGVGRCSGDGCSNVLERRLTGCRAQNILSKLPHGRTLTGLDLEEFNDVERGIKIGAEAGPAGDDTGGVC